MKPKKLRIADPETFHLRKRILELAGVSYKESGQWLVLNDHFESLPEKKRRMIEAALECRFNWQEMQGLDAKEKVAIGIAAMDVDWFRKKHAAIGA